MSGKLHAPAAVPLGTTPVPIEYEAGRAPAVIWTLQRRAKSLGHGGIRIRDRSARKLVTILTEPQGLMFIRGGRIC
jgi:hypothetical protein